MMPIASKKFRQQLVRQPAASAIAVPVLVASSPTLRQQDMKALPLNQTRMRHSKDVPLEERVYWEAVNAQGLTQQQQMMTCAGCATMQSHCTRGYWPRVCKKSFPTRTSARIRLLCSTHSAGSLASPRVFPSVVSKGLHANTACSFTQILI